VKGNVEMARPRKPRRRKRRNGPPGVVDGTCRDCRLPQKVNRVQFFKAFPPRCTSCGGLVDRAAFARRVDAAHRKLDAETRPEASSSLATASDLIEPRPSGAVGDDSATEAVRFDGRVPCGAHVGRELGELGDGELVAEIEAAEVAGGSPAYIAALRSEAARRDLVPESGGAA